MCYKIKMLRHSEKKAIKASLDILKLIEKLLKKSLCVHKEQRGQDVNFVKLLLHLPNKKKELPMLTYSFQKSKMPGNWIELFRFSSSTLLVFIKVCNRT